jgi:hypothetical protein
MSPDYKRILLEEIYFLVSKVGFKYDEIRSMPVYIRRFFIYQRIDEYEAEKAEYEKNKKH